jgi:hypothetical protein
MRAGIVVVINTADIKIIYTKSCYMKFRFFIVAAAIAGFAACKSPYKATDRAKSTTDTTANTSAIMNHPTPATDTAGVSRMDSTKLDPTTKQFPDSAKMDSTSKPLTDSVRTDTTSRTFQDSSRMDSTRRDTTSMRNDASKTNPSIDATATQSQTPAVVEPVFSKQYPTAANAVWSNYDSLANVPIDMRLTGWKKLDKEDHMVKFDFEDETYYAWYDSNGKWIGSAYTMKDISKLPPKVQTAVQNAIKTRYVGYEISQVNRELQTGKSAYEVELAKGDTEVRMLVTPAGKITQIFKYSKQKSK